MKHDQTAAARWYRRQVHDLLDERFPNKGAKYAWLDKHTTTSHMSQMNEVELRILYYQLLSSDSPWKPGKPTRPRNKKRTKK